MKRSNDTPKRSKKSNEEKHTKAFHELNDFIHDQFGKVDDEVEKRELAHYIGTENDPDFDKLDENADNLTIEEVMLLGSYLAVARIHHELHEVMDKHVGGGTGLPQVAFGTLENMPPELKAALRSLLDDEDSNKRNKKGSR